MSNWKLYDPQAPAAEQPQKLPPSPRWRQAGAERARVLGETFQPDAELVDAVNTALYLRRPLLLTGRPGTGKSSLAYSIARQVGLGRVIEWAVNSRSTLQQGLYHYDALARLQHIQQLNARAGEDAVDEEASELGLFLTLGPLGTALASASAPRVLLVDEIDKSDVDLPNDLLNVLDTGHFGIPELQRAKRRHPRVTLAAADGEEIVVSDGEITFTEFPVVVMTSNGERDFPAPFLRRCVQCQIPEPTPAQLTRIVAAHFGAGALEGEVPQLITDFVEKRASIALATDQLLNAIHLLDDPKRAITGDERKGLMKTLFQGLG